MIVYAPAPVGFPHGEDAFLANFFRDTPSGTFVEIGAHVGVHYSNTRPLWERGWSGVFIEPDPQSFDALSKLYASRERATLLNVAVSTMDGTARFAQHVDPSHSGWHSLDPSWVATWGKQNTHWITVKTRSIASLLASNELPQACDFLSIDTEGHDAVIVESIPDSWRPRLICVEVDKPRVRERVDHAMEQRRYAFAWGNYLNALYRRLD